MRTPSRSSSNSVRHGPSGAEPKRGARAIDPPLFSFDGDLWRNIDGDA